MLKNIYTISYKSLIDKPFNQNKMIKLLEIMKEELKWRGTEYIKINKNQLDFENRILTIRIPFTLMHSIDGGLLKISKTDEDTFNIEYEISLIRVWIKNSLVFLVLLFSSKEILFSFLLFILLILGDFGFAYLRHRLFFKKIKKIMIEKGFNSDKHKNNNQPNSNLYLEDYP